MIVQSNGRIVPGVVKPELPKSQQITGTPIQAATNKTLASTAAAAETAKSMGAGQKGGKRKTRRRKVTRRRRYRGGENMNAKIPKLPEAGTIPGVSFSNNHLKSTNLLNQIRADAAGDKLGNAPPVQMGGLKKKRSTRRRIR